MSDVPHIRLQVGQMTVDFSNPEILYNEDGNHFESGSGDYLAASAFHYLKLGILPPDEDAFNLTSEQVDEVKRLVTSRIVPVSHSPESSYVRLSAETSIGDRLMLSLEESPSG